MGGLRTDDAKHFFIFFANVLIQHYISVCYAMFAASISREFHNAALVGNLGYTLQSMACGFFVNAQHMPVYVRWTRWIAYVYYGFGAMISNQFNGYIGDCPYPAEDPRCVPYTGEYVLDLLGFPHDWITLPLCVNVAWGLGFYVVAGLLLKYLRISITVSRTFNTKQEQIVERVETAYTQTIPITVSLEDVHLQVKRRGVKSRSINILQGINASFYPGSINAIFGPSGSGKSSLLNYIAGRLSSTAWQKYTSSGSIIFNDTIPSSSVVHSICSYVTQEDDGLLPSLTVRETLYYSAYLRLPKQLTRKQKRAKADEVILKMGLKDCADTLIGGEFVKGISGGERRRVSICIQLLNDPKILLLDEPTSGLDSFTAASILQVLKSLSEEGKTIICTIHQPRSDLFPQFGNILLLAKGGRVAYDGKSDNMLDHFANLGYPCPTLTNPADHVLDMVSVNLQAAWKEEESRKKVNAILEKWQDITNRRERLQPSRSAELPAQFKSYVRKPAGFFLAYTTLCSRGIVNFSRSPQMVVARIMQVVGIGIIFCLFFAPMKDSQIGVTNRLGLVQEATALYFVGMLNNMAIYPQDKAVFYREYDDNVYGTIPFFLMYTTLEVPFEVVTSFLFSVFLVIIPGLKRTPEMFFACAYISFAIVNCGESLGIAFNTIFQHEGFAVNVISVVLSIGSLMAGILSLNMPGFLKGVNWLSPLKYGVSVLINMAMQDQHFTCDEEESSSGQCQFTTGEQVLDGYNLKASVPSYLGAITACVVIYRLLSFAILKINRLRLGINSFKPNNND